MRTTLTYPPAHHVTALMYHTARDDLGLTSTPFFTVADISCIGVREYLIQVDRLRSAKNSLPADVYNQLELLLSNQVALAEAGVEPRSALDNLFMDELNTINLFKR